MSEQTVAARGHRAGGHTPARPVLYVLIGIASVQFGAAFSKQLFGEISPTGMVWLRVLTSAAVLLAVARPRWSGRTRADWYVALAFGLSLATMNWAIYQSFARIPLGLAVTIELLGPLGVALAWSRRGRDLIWVVLAGLGVALLGLRADDLTWSGVAFALLAAAAWAAYIPLSVATGRRWLGVGGLATASLVGVVVLALPAVLSAGDALLDPRILVIGAVAGLLSSVVPYSLELSALRSLTPHTFGVLMSLEPAAAAVVGVVVLSEHLGPSQWAAIVCVVLASAGATRSARRDLAAPA